MVREGASVEALLPASAMQWPRLSGTEERAGVELELQRAEVALEEEVRPPA